MLYDDNKNRKKIIIITALEILVVSVTLFFALSFLIKNNVNGNTKDVKGTQTKAYMEPIKVYALTENPQFEVSGMKVGVNSKDVDVKVEYGAPVDVDVKVNKAKKTTGTTK
jgi:hypothetical protein